jgi:CRP/FNR family transcriptional regulator, cyclic AMP receptor protein
VCWQLWLLVDEQEKVAFKQGQIRNPPTHMEIAIMLNLSRETVTRVFQTLQQEGVVQRDGTSRLLIPSLPLLKSFVDGGKEL